MDILGHDAERKTQRMDKKFGMSEEKGKEQVGMKEENKRNVLYNVFFLNEAN